MNGRFLILICFLLISCEKEAFESGFENSIANNFEVFWQDLDRHYSHFELKQANWDSIYVHYQPIVNDPMTTSQDLFTIFQEIVQYLQDGHVNVYAGSTTIGYDPMLPTQAPYSWIGEDLSAIERITRPLSIDRNTLFYRKLESENIGYIWIRSFGGSIDNFGFITDLIEDWQDTKGIILDVRQNGGGNSSNALFVANKFADQAYLYQKVRYRNGPEHNDFTEWRDSYLEPQIPYYGKPVVVLTNRKSFSSAEGFALMMQAIPGVTLMGEPSAGSTGNPVFRDLPNGWSYRFSNWQAVDPKMEFVEGRGVLPNIEVQISQADYDQEFDQILQTAIEFLK